MGDSDIKRLLGFITEVSGQLFRLVCRGVVVVSTIYYFRQRRNVPYFKASPRTIRVSVHVGPCFPCLSLSF